MADHPATAATPGEPTTWISRRRCRFGPRAHASGGRVAPGSAEEKRLREIWEAPPGWRGWLSTVDHKTIGLRYLVTAFIFLLMGGVEALIMRVQLARPNATLLTPEQYNQLFTMHGVTMIFLYALPVLSGFSNYLWPLMLGSRDMAFPRLNALSYWVFLFAGIFLYASFPLGRRRTPAGSTTCRSPASNTTPGRISTSTRSAWCCSASRRRSAR